MRWMEIAWAEQGTAEIEGPESNPQILQYFKTAGFGAVTSEDMPWCGAFAGACLAGAGLPRPSDARVLRARAYLDIGTPITAPRVGAIVVLSRPDAGPTAGHVGFVSGWTETHVAVLGGNQGDAVTVAHFPRSQVVGYRWPVPPATATDLSNGGSRIVRRAGELLDGAKRQVSDAAKATFAIGTGVAAKMTEPERAVETASQLMGKAQVVEAFLLFAWSKWWLLASVAGAWFLARLVVRAGQVESGAGAVIEARLEDHNTGANVARLEQGSVVDAG
jgi:uncharacterized protein (TIGR02594 family)